MGFIYMYVCLYVCMYVCMNIYISNQIDGLVQERRNSIANALDLRLSCSNPSRWRLPNGTLNLTQSRVTSRGLNKTYVILRKIFSKRTMLNENHYVSIQIALNFISRGPVDNKSTLVQVMAWRRSGDKPLPKPMMTQYHAIIYQGWF